MKLIDYNYRQIKNQLVYFADPAFAAKYAGSFGMENPVGLVTYCYVDRERGLVFEVLALAVEQDGMVGFTGNRDEIRADFTYNDCKDCEAFPLMDIDTTPWLDKINGIVSANRCDEIVLAFRNEAMFDEFRVMHHPDIVNVTAFKPGSAMHSCQVRFDSMDEKGMHGTVITAPVEDMGISVGDVIDFFLYQVAPEMNTLVCPLK